MVIYPKDHGPPHVHVIAPEAEAKFELKGMICFYSRGFSKRDLRRIGTFLVEHKALLMEAWNDYQA